MTEEKYFELERLFTKLEKEGGYFLDFLRTGSLEAGLIVLPPGTQDTQGPHSADELYFVIEGSGFIELGKDKREIKRGSIIFVPAKMQHRFSGNTENLTVLYVFAG